MNLFSEVERAILQSKIQDIEENLEISEKVV